MALHVLILSLLMASPALGERVSLRGAAMGTRWMILAHGVDLANGKDLQSRVEERLEVIERSMSTWRPDSEISRFNLSRSTNWFPVSRDFARVMKRGLEIARVSGGAFDPTVLPLVRLWGFAGQPREAPPGDAEIATALKHVGFGALAVRMEPPAIRKRDGGVEIDLSAIAKGFAVDAVGELLDGRHGANWLVDIGGEVRVRGLSPKGRAWRIGIEAPFVGVRRIHDAVELNGGGVATSGDYRNFIVIGGRRHAHIVDAASGLPIPQRGLAVSVRAEDCLTADAWATALCVLGPDRGLALAAREGVAAQFLTRSEDAVTVARTPGWRDSP